MFSLKMEFKDLVLLVSGFLAGSIDSIAGGGGLITLPVLSMYLPSAAWAVGTNKIVGTTGALVALLIYSRQHKPKSWGPLLAFVFSVGAGSLLGSRLTPLIPQTAFKALVLLACPLILLLVLQRRRWLNRHSGLEQSSGDYGWKLLAMGVACGIYDGAFGPGGGTFMLMALVMGTRIPIIQALVLSKAANTLSASVALASFSSQGFVNFKMGGQMAIGMAFGAVLGSTFASKRAEKLVRPVLALAVGLLCLRLGADVWAALKAAL